MILFNSKQASTKIMEGTPGKNEIKNQSFSQFLFREIMSNKIIYHMTHMRKNIKILRKDLVILIK